VIFKSKCLLTTIVIVVILGTDINLFIPESASLIWHIQHGSSIEMNGVRFRVPLFYIGRADSARDTVFIDGQAGWLRHKIARPGQVKSGLIMISFLRQSAGRISAEAAAQNVSRWWTKEGYVLNGRRAQELAGHQGTCDEYSLGANPNPKLAESGTQVYCYFDGNVAAIFQGNRRAVADFYSVLQTSHTKRNT